MFLSTFAGNVQEVLPLDDSRSASPASWDTAAMKVELQDLREAFLRNSRRETDFISLFKSAEKLGQMENSVLILLTDGVAMTEQFSHIKKWKRRNKREIKAACAAAEEFRNNFPLTDILCFQNNEGRLQKDFLECACDTIFLTNENPDPIFVADQMRNHICSPLRKKEDPCEAVDRIELISRKKKKKTCLSILRNVKGEIPFLNPESLLQDARLNKQCKFKRGKCFVDPKFKPLYKRD